MAEGMTSRRGLASERGAELVEFAFALPLLLVVLGGIIDFGFMFQRLEVVTNAAREGARLASLPSYGLADVQSRSKAYLDASLGTGTSTHAVVSMTSGIVTPPSGTNFTTATVTVTLTESYWVLGPLISLIGGDPAKFGDITLTGKSTMRLELPGS